MHCNTIPVAGKEWIIRVLERTERVFEPVIIRAKMSVRIIVRLRARFYNNSISSFRIGGGKEWAVWDPKR